MRFIPTSAAKVDKLKKQAKTLQRNGGGKHADLLDRVARSHGYDHWHHVVLCAREADDAHRSRGLLPEIEAIMAAATSGIGKFVVTGPEALQSRPFLLVSTDQGDAWMFDPQTDQALCLVWRGERQPVTVRDLPTRSEVEWDGKFELRGEFIVFATGHPQVGNRAVAGYPVDELRALLEDIRSADKRAETIFGGADAVDLTPEIIGQLATRGWSAEELARLATRDSMIGTAQALNPDGARG